MANIGGTEKRLRAIRRRRPRSGNNHLKILLFDEQVVGVPFVIGQLACGTLQKRKEILSLLRALPEVELLEHEEVMTFLERRRLYGRGIGWVDAHLLASMLLMGCSIWTFDKPLRKAAAALNV